MQAVVQRSFGGPSVLELAEVERPEPIPSEVLVRIRASGVNPIDAMARSGALAILGPPPFVLGWDISGVVEEVVPGVTRFQVGDEVYGMPFFPRQAGGYAEYLAVPSRQLARKPDRVDHVHAAALPLVGLTAWHSLVDVAKVEAGQRVLVHAGAGGVGHLAIQIAAACGAHVITTASASKHEYLMSIGADEVIDYRAVDFTDVVHGIDVVLDSVGRGYGERSLETLRTGGLLITVVERTNAALRSKAKLAGMRFAGVTVEPDYVGLEALADLVDAGRLYPHVEHTLPLAEVARSHELIESGRTTGKIVLAG
jgi:NADPH:quinone reductase-like Zn-dependent oxidoreductase